MSLRPETVDPRLLSADSFAALMAPLGPFEDGARLAVALSGGADSLALVLLAADWARGRGGAVLALIVDHGLRPESAAEAASVAAQMQRHGIAHDILRWDGDKPRRGVQMAAREARYRLLVEACRARGILHLLVGHHAGDQAETVAIRAERGSGPAGLAGMGAVAPPPVAGPRWPRLLRPLLRVPKAALVDWLVARGESWIEDPSNQNLAFARVRVRAGLDDGMAAGLAARAQEAQDSAAAETARLLPLLLRDVSLHPAGFASLTPHPFAAAGEDLRRAGWRRLLMTVGGLAYPPRGEDLDRLMARVMTPGFRGATLAGCRIDCGPKQWRLVREQAAVREEAGFRDGMMWDGRFWLSGAGPGLVVKAYDGPDIPGLPAAVRRCLPGLWRDGRSIGLPLFAGFDGPPEITVADVRAQFLPPKALVY